MKYRFPYEPVYFEPKKKRPKKLITFDISTTAFDRGEDQIPFGVLSSQIQCAKRIMRDKAKAKKARQHLRNRPIRSLRIEITVIKTILRK